MSKIQFCSYLIKKMLNTLNFEKFLEYIDNLILNILFVRVKEEYTYNI